MVLPSASRAARGGLAVDDESIPLRPPFIAHISNLPYDVEESAIMELFAGLKVRFFFYLACSSIGTGNFQPTVKISNLLSTFNLVEMLIGRTQHYISSYHQSAKMK